MTEADVSPLQQINLVNRALLPTQEIFSARLILVWVSVAIVLMVAVAGWAVIETRKLNNEISRSVATQAAERARIAPLESDTGAFPSAQQIVASEQSLRTSHTLLDTRRAVRDTLMRGVADDKSGPSALMRKIAGSLPPQAWLTEFRVSGAQIECTGKTLDPIAVKTWLDTLGASGFLAGKQLPAIRIEKVDVPAPSTARSPTVFTFAITAVLSFPFADDGGRP